MELLGSPIEKVTMLSGNVFYLNDISKVIALASRSHIFEYPFTHVDDHLGLDKSFYPICDARIFQGQTRLYVTGSPWKQDAQ